MIMLRAQVITIIIRQLPEQGVIPYHDYTETFKSFGFELMADFYILRIPFMISGGVQAAWKNIDEKPSLELLFNIDLFGMTLGKNRL